MAQVQTVGPTFRLEGRAEARSKGALDLGCRLAWGRGWTGPCRDSRPGLPLPVLSVTECSEALAPAQVRIGTTGADPESGCVDRK